MQIVHQRRLRHITLAFDARVSTSQPTCYAMCAKEADGARILAFGLFAIVATFAMLLVPSTVHAQNSGWDVLKTTSHPDFVLYEPPLFVAWSMYGSSTEGLPVLVYLHGSFEMTEDRYEPLLEDLARAGYVVVFPKYDARFGTNMSDWYRDAKAITDNALLELDKLPWAEDGIGHYRRDVSQIALSGHSAGGMFALKLSEELAVESRETGVGQPRALILHDPGGFGFWGLAIMQNNSRWLDNLYNIPTSTEMVILVSEDSFLDETREEYDGDAVRVGNSVFGGVWTRAWRKTNIANAHKHFYIVSGDHSGMSWNYATYGAPYLRVTTAALDSALNGDGAFPQHHIGAWNVSSALYTDQFRVRNYVSPSFWPFF